MGKYCTLLVLVVAGCAIENAPREYDNYPPPVQQITTTQVSVGQTFTASSRDGTFGIHFTPGAFLEPVSVKISQGSSSPAPAVTLSKTYAVTVTPATASLQQPVELSFVMSAAAVEAGGGAANLRVGHGETLGQPWAEALSGNYDSELGRFTTVTSSFSYFLVFDQSGYLYCECDDGPGCQTGCEFCDSDCETPDCVLDSDCDSNCCLEGACVDSAYCEEPLTCEVDGDCDSTCCLDNVCMPSSYCEEPECYEDYDCESGCCVSNTCMPSSTCVESCSYDYECSSECCYDGVCADSSYCVGSCSYDYECETECCYDGICADASYCIETCNYDYECDTECCYDGVCADSSYCVETCTYDYNCESGCCIDGICAPASECASCVTGALRCSDNWVQECVGGEWSYEGTYSQDCSSQGLTCVDYPSDSWAACESVGCDPETEWQCNDGDCIAAEYRCDRYSEGPDCVDGSDEDPYCPTCTSDQDCPEGEYWQCDISTGTCFQGV